MSIKYDSKRESLADIIKKATNNATYVIPDLQRPYVWSPRQVMMLIDSLFRGWPFGSLLLWEVKPDCFQQNEGLPHRPFWQVVDRTGNDRETKGSPLAQPATYQMVLDGQQRVQSLILALGGDHWGFQLYDADWALDLQDRRVKPTTRWSRASLCVDLQKFESELREKNNKVRKIEAGKIIEWVVLDVKNDRSPEPPPANYVFPVQTVAENPGRFIRLSRFWDLVQTGLSEGEYREILEPVLAQHGVDATECLKLLDPLSQFMKMIENVKTTGIVHALQIESFELTPQWSRDDYSDAIVNIFTRLNTAGRTLTREEITLAWLKIGWEQDETDHKTAGACLEELREELAYLGMTVELDEIVRLISFMWAVEFREGVLLDSKDLLKGEIIRPMAASIARAWKSLQNHIWESADLLKEGDYAKDFGSFNAVIVFMTWRRAVFDALQSVGHTVQLVQRDALEKIVKQRSGRFLDRWIWGSQWANVWGDGAVLNFQTFAFDLRAASRELSAATAENLVVIVDSGIERLMGRVLVRATEQINNFVVRERKRVHSYYNFLWVWHRLDAARWKNSSIPMRDRKKQTTKLEVDHTVADAWWRQLVAEETLVKQSSFTGTAEERAAIAPEGFSSVDEALAFINLLGNCSLLEKSFNISKSARPLRTFLQDVLEFKEGTIQIVEWEEALSLPPTLTNPEGATLNEIREAVEARDQLIRRELNEFVSGVRFRVDELSAAP